VAEGLYHLWAGTDGSRIGPGVGFIVLVVIAMGGESGITVLLDRWGLI
jgi:hypothetical protein